MNLRDEAAEALMDGGPGFAMPISHHADWSRSLDALLEWLAVNADRIAEAAKERQPYDMENFAWHLKLAVAVLGGDDES
jgi:hypothetical protein